MERRNFLKMMGAGAVVIALPPIGLPAAPVKVIATIPPPLAAPRTFVIRNLSVPDPLGAFVDHDIFIGMNGVPVLKIMPGETCQFTTDISPVLQACSETGVEIRAEMWCIDETENIEVQVFMVE